MKRSRIFLGITTSLLAIVGVAAAKAHRIPKAVHVYYKVAGNANCTRVVATFCTKLGPSLQCYYLGVYTLYTQITAPCGHIVKYNQF